ncbi:hypothetical protein ACEPAI_2964 [Sanghuangporus weigelae]
MSDLDLRSSLQSRSTFSIDPSIVPSLFSTYTKQKYVLVALSAVLVYHSLISLDQEVKFFWPKPRSSVSLIYFTNRYIGLLAAIFNIADLFTMLIIEYILVIRVLALYHQDKKLSIFLKALLALVAVDGFAFRAHGIVYQGEALGIVAEGVSFCFIEREYPMNLMVAAWILPIVFGLILMGLSLHKAAEHWRVSHDFKGLHLMHVLFRDQFIYYGLVSFYAISQLVGAALVNVNGPAAFILATVSSPTTLCILGGQLLINLKEAGEKGENGGLNYTPQSVSDIQFVSVDGEQQEDV